jgi:hypothetical protein
VTEDELDDPAPVELDLDGMGGMGMKELAREMYPILSLEARMAERRRIGKAGVDPGQLRFAGNGAMGLGIGAMMGLSPEEVRVLKAEAGTA